MSDKLNKFADPPLRFDRAGRQLPGGKDVVVVQVAEFDDISVLAARDFPRHIQRGHLYTRSFRKPESSATHTQNELRAVLELATQKQVAKFFSLAAAANLTKAGIPSAQSRYDEESTEYLADAGISGITAAAHFKFTIRPQEFLAERIDYTAIASLIRREALHLRGWPYPFVSRSTQGASWVTEQETVMHREGWVAFESGQFQSWHALPLDGRHAFDGGADAKPGHAQRLQAAVAPAEPQQITLELLGAKGWELAPGDRRWRPFHEEHRLQTSGWERTMQLPAGSGPDSGRELAVAPSLHLLRRFGWAGASEQVVRSVQDEVFGPV